MKKRFSETAARLMAGKGFYIALMVCVAAIGIGAWAAGGFGSGPVVTDPLPTATAPVFHPQTPAPSDSGAPTPTVTPRPTAEPLPSRWVWPLEGEVTRPFSVEELLYDHTMGDWRTHAGLDIAGQLGDSVVAAADGTVSAIEKGGPLGVTVTLRHSGGAETRYAGLSEDLAVRAGDKVTAGQKLGTVGDTAAAESAAGPHLHLELRLAGEKQDPAAWLP